MASFCMMLEKRDTMKPIRALLAALLAIGSTALANESALITVFQPMDGLGTGEIHIESVPCHDPFPNADPPSDVQLITAKNIPPTTEKRPLDDHNVASGSRLKIVSEEGEDGKHTIHLDCSLMKVPERFGFSEAHVVAATLECLRRTAGDRWPNLKLMVKYKKKGQDAVRKVVDDFLKHPKDKEFPWKEVE